MTKSILLASLLLGACTVGEVSTPNQQGGPDANNNNPGVDSGGTPGGDSGVADLACIDRSATIGIAHAHGGAGGPTNAGLACNSGACHGNGGNAPMFQFAGTLYIKGTNTPDPGAVLIIVPDNAAIAPIKLVTDNAGNFSRGVTQGAMPASTRATACPTITSGHLAGKLNGNTTPGKGGDCNGCHNGTTQATLYVGP